MKKAVMRISVALLIIGFIFCFDQPHADATGLVPFGGHILLEFPCTCEAGALFVGVLFPVYLDAVPSAGLMVIPPVIAFPIYRDAPLSWALGYYIPGAGVCLVGVEPYCVSIPNLGLISPYSGASAPAVVQAST
jgi:hypothetical protein